MARSENRPGIPESKEHDGIPATVEELKTLAQAISQIGRENNVAYRIIQFFINNANQPVPRLTLFEAINYQGEAVNLYRYIRKVFTALRRQGFSTDIGLQTLHEDRYKPGDKNKQKTTTLRNRVVLVHVRPKQGLGQ